MQRQNPEKPMKCPVCRAAYRKPSELPNLVPKPCHRCGADLTALIRLHDYAIYLHRQAIAQFAAGDVTQAIETNETAIAIHLQQPKFHAFAGQLWAVQGDFKAAARSWQTAQQLDPKDTIVADCLSILKELKSATTL